jgi:hypothetical protein
MGGEEQLLSASIAETIGKARTAATKVSYVIEGIAKVAELNDNEELHEAEETLRFYLNPAFPNRPERD